MSTLSAMEVALAKTMYQIEKYKTHVKVKVINGQEVTTAAS